MTDKKTDGKKDFDPMDIMKDINCMFFGACNRKQLDGDTDNEL
jgi:hypothetical protein